MKKFIKFAPVALGVLLLASCNSDDFLNENSETRRSLEGKTIIKATVEGDATTRAYAYGDAAIVFADGDFLRAYDGDVKKYDAFTFDGTNNVFVINDEANRAVTDKAYRKALFGAEGAISYAGWNEGHDVALVKLITPVTYEESSATISGTETDVYINALPMWGDVTPVTGQSYEFTTDLKRLTGYARIGFKNGKDHIKAVRVRSLKFLAGATDEQKAAFKKGKVISAADADDFVEPSEDAFVSGWFDARLEDNGILVETAAPVEAVENKHIFEVSTEDGGVSLMSKYNNYVYLPIVPQEYDILSFEYKNAADQWVVIGAAKDYTATRSSKVNLDVEGFASEIDMDDTTLPEHISAKLAEHANSPADLTLNVAQLNVTQNNYAPRYTIYVPAMQSGNVKVDVAALVNTVSPQPQKLVIENKAGGAYAGMFTLGLAANAEHTPIEINLPNADVVLVGTYAAEDNVTIKAAKSLTIGDGTTVTSIADPITTVENATSHLSTITEGITVKANATLGSSFTINGVYTGKDTTYPVVIEGVTKAFEARFADVSVQGDGQITGTLYTKGNVTVESTKTIAVAGIAYNGTGKTITLKKGGISLIKTKAYATADEVPATLNTLTITNVETGKTQIGDIQDYQNIGGDDTKVLNVTFEKSVWFGEKTDPSSALANPAKIYTASQLASIEGDKDYTLMTNMDLNHKPWTPLTLTNKSFDGNNKVIENMSIAATGNAGTGFFKKISKTGDTGVTVKNLTFKKATITSAAAVSNVGILAGIIDNTGASQCIDIIKVKVAGSTDASSINLFGASSNVGGLVGQSKCSIANNYIKNGSSVSGLTIKGYYNLGGLVGLVDGVFTTDGTSANAVTVNNLTFDQTWSSQANYDVHYLQVGQLIGALTQTVNVNIAGTPAAADAGFTANRPSGIEFKYPVVQGGLVIGKNIVFGQSSIGFCGLDGGNDPIIPTENKVQFGSTKYNAYASNADYTTAKGDAADFKFLFYVNK